MINGWVLTRHAQKRRKGMGVTEAVIASVVNSPEYDVPSWTYPGRRMAFGTDLVVIYQPETKEIITVLWKSGRYQTRAQVAGRRLERGGSSDAMLAGR